MRREIIREEGTDAMIKTHATFCLMKNVLTRNNWYIQTTQRAIMLSTNHRRTWAQVLSDRSRKLASFSRMNSCSRLISMSLSFNTLTCCVKLSTFVVCFESRILPSPIKKSTVTLARSNLESFIELGLEPPPSSHFFLKKLLGVMQIRCSPDSIVEKVNWPDALPR